MITFLHNSRSESFRSPFGSVPAGEKVTLSIESYEDNLDNPAEIKLAELSLRFFGTEDESEKETFEPVVSAIPLAHEAANVTETEHGKRLKTVFSCTLNCEKQGVYFYGFHFVVREDGRDINLFYGNNEECIGGIGACREGLDGNYYTVTVHKKGLKVPEWFKKSVIYQIFPDRFCKGYDALAEQKPNSFMYGTWDDLPMYIKNAENDVVRWDFHGGNLSGVSEKLPYIEALGANVIYLNPVFKAASNHRYDTEDYMHVDGLLGGDPAMDLLLYVSAKDNVKIMLDGVFSHTGSDSIYFDKLGKYGGGAYKNKNSKYRDWYRFSEDSDDSYDCWWGVDVLPNVNELAPGYLDFIARDDDSVVKHWLRKGVAGFRLDVADELPDRFIKELANACKEVSAETGLDPVLLGEVWEDASTKVSYGKLRSYFTERELSTVTDYPFRKILLAFFGGDAGADKTAERFLSLKENYPRENYYALVNMTGSHDVKRLMTAMLEAAGGKKTLARRYVANYAAVMFTFPGVPLVYYGDETCLEGGEDPDNRRTYPWGREDKNMISVFAALAGIRKKNPCLVKGEIEFLSTPIQDVLAYKRTLGSDEAIVVISRGSEPETEVELELEKGSYEPLFGAEEGATVTCGEDGKVSLTITNGCAIYKKI
ncbi:MAG: glycoside hydrolase family 13 protein [Clostridia bacterium]|nr:glycoside hydrolase family 13 protein [Clostridia bacterium]